MAQGNEFSGLGELRLRRGAGFSVGVLAFLVSALVFFTEATLSAAPIRDVSVSLVVTMLSCVVMYTSMADAGCRAGEEREEYTAAVTEWRALADEVRSRGLMAGLASYCRRLALEERENARLDLLAAVGLGEEGYRALLADPERCRRADRRVRRTLRRVAALRLLALPPYALLSAGGTARRRELLPASPGRSRAKATALAMIPALTGSIVTVSVVFTARTGLDAGTVISALFRLLALLWTGVRGYGMGFRSVTVDAVHSARVRSTYLARYLKESAPGSEDEK